MSETTKKLVALFSCCSACVVLLSAMSVRAQMGASEVDPSDPGTGGRNTIEGNIYYPSGRRLDKRVRVTLSAISRSDNTGMTDDSGSFTFRRLGGGSYTVTVDAGKEYEPVIERVDINQASPSRRGSSGITYTVQIQLRYQKTAAQPPAVIDAALASVPKQAVDLYEQAEVAARSGDDKRAIEELKAAIAIYPEFWQALDKLGVEYMLLGQLSDAEQAFRSALRINRDLFDALLNYGILHVLEKKYLDAEKELRHAVVQNDSSATAHAYLGRCLAIQRKVDEGEKELRRALDLGADSIGWVYRYLGGIYFERHDNERTISAMEKYLQLVPNASDADQIRELLKSLRAQAKASKP